MVDEFVLLLLNDIHNAKQKTEYTSMDSFPDFLKTITSEKLKYYSDIVEKLLDTKNIATSEEIQIAVVLYTYAVTIIESQHDIDGMITLDLSGSWVTSMFSFLTMEKLFREGFLDDYSGFLYKEDLLFKPSEKMRNLSIQDFII